MKRERNDEQDDGGKSAAGDESSSHIIVQRPASASGGISSPLHPSRRRQRPASSKPRGSPEKKADAENAYEDDYLVEEDSDWEDDGEDTDYEDVEGLGIDTVEEAGDEDAPKKRKPSKRELLANVKELAKRALELSSATRAAVDKLSSV